MIFNTLYSPPEKLEDIIYREAEEKALKIRKILAEAKQKDTDKSALKQSFKDDFFIADEDEEAKISKKSMTMMIISPNQAYYYKPRKNRATLGYYSNAYSPGTIINRVPQSVLGHNVLGRAFIGLNYVEILETLQGNDFEEVKQHEMNHINFPHLTEQEIRSKTRYDLPFEARYN